jgi:heme exporter protein A
MSSPQIALSAIRLSKRIGGRLIFSGVDLEIHEGQCVAFLGPNGAGKTTLLRCLAALVRPSSGEVRWFGESAASTPALRGCVGMAAHDSFLYPQLSVRENLLFAARMCDLSDPHHRVDDWLRTAALEPLAAMPVKNLSRGMRQRITLLRAMVHNPRILLLDEPFAALDAAGATWLKELLHDFRGRAGAICFSTHDYTLAQTCADRVLLLENGSLQELERTRLFDEIPLNFARAA